MLPAPIPPDDARRLDSLSRLQLLDTPPEDRFDRITQTAQRLLNAPIALLVLVDAEREWFKSRQGVETTEAPRTTSLCGHALLAEDLFVVPDTLRDPRFVDNPTVIFGPHVRFYAGKPLHSPDGSKVGVLCIEDCRPRQLNRVEEETLRYLAAWAERELNRPHVTAAPAARHAT